MFHNVARIGPYS